jgi:hypothetical protein
VSTDLKKTLDELGETLATAALLDATPFDQRLDAFKALTAYYALQLKRKVSQDDDPDEPTMETLRRDIQGDRNGRTRSRVRDS